MLMNSSCASKYWETSLSVEFTIPTLCNSKTFEDCKKSR